MNGSQQSYSRSVKVSIWPHAETNWPFRKGVDPRDPNVMADVLDRISFALDADVDLHIRPVRFAVPTRTGQVKVSEWRGFTYVDPDTYAEVSRDEYHADMRPRYKHWEGADIDMTNIPRSELDECAFIVSTIVCECAHTYPPVRYDLWLTIATDEDSYRFKCGGVYDSIGMAQEYRQLYEDALKGMVAVARLRSGHVDLRTIEDRMNFALAFGGQYAGAGADEHEVRALHCIAVAVAEGMVPHVSVTIVQQ